MSDCENVPLSACASLFNYPIWIPNCQKLPFFRHKRIFVFEVYSFWVSNCDTNNPLRHQLVRYFVKTFPCLQFCWFRCFNWVNRVTKSNLKKYPFTQFATKKCLSAPTWFICVLLILFSENVTCWIRRLASLKQLITAHKSVLMHTPHFVPFDLFFA